LEEFYTLTKIDIHFFAIELNDLNIVDISHTSYPNITVIEALCMTTCLPVVFEPFIVNDVYYVDAGLIVNYPLSYCLQYLENIKGGVLNREDKLEILGLNINQENTETKTTTDIIKQSNLIIYSLYMMKKLIKKKYNIIKPEDVPNTITYYTQESIFTSLLESLSSPEKRETYIQEGINYAIEFNLEQL
jgi:predicted acylesterase/phospholipase RssA